MTVDPENSCRGLGDTHFFKPPGHIHANLLELPNTPGTTSLEKKQK